MGGIPEIFDKYQDAVASPEYQSYDANNQVGRNREKNEFPYPPNHRFPIPQSCGLPRDDFGHLFRDASTGDIPWTGVFTGMIITSVWYWCADQVIVQRTLASKNLTHAKAGCIVAGVCKLLPFFMLVIPGMAARVLWPDYVCKKSSMTLILFLKKSYFTFR